MREFEDPLVDPPPPEVPLANAPLVRVIAQVRFPEILAVEQREFVAPFQEAIRAQFPVLRQEQMQGVLLGPLGFAPVKPQTAWRFSDVEGHWRLSLTPEFLALETSRYVSRLDLLSRLRAVLVALERHVEPRVTDRLGIRYVDRISGAAVDEIQHLVREEVRGISGTAAARHAAHALSETVFAVGDDRVLARWGTLPANATIDPAVIEPLAEKSWILDLDMYSAAPMPFSPDRLVDEARRYAERVYAIFRWAVTDAFLRRYGGNP